MSTSDILKTSKPPHPVIEVRAQTGCGSSALTHLVTAVALGIIFGAAAFFSVYYLNTQNIDMWTTMIGGGVAVLTTLVSYAIMRTALARKTEIEISNKPTDPVHSFSEHDPEIPNDSSIKKPIQTSSKDSHVKGSSAKKSFFVEGRNAIVQKDLYIILNEINSESFFDELKEKAVELYDPTNELPFSYLDLFQRLLSITENKKGLMRTLFAKALEDDFTNKLLNAQEVRNRLKSFDQKTIDNFAYKIRDTELKNILRKYNPKEYIVTLSKAKGTESKTSIDFLPITESQEIKRQVSTFAGDKKWSFGTARDDGSCFYHAMAQCLTHLLGKVITEKQLREQCVAYTMKLGQTESRHLLDEVPVDDITLDKKQEITTKNFNIYDDVEEEEDLTEDDCEGKVENIIDNKMTWIERSLRNEDSVLDQLRSTDAISSKDTIDINSEHYNKIVNWGRSDIHGKILAELYGIELVVFQVIKDDTHIFESDEPLYIKPYIEKDRISLSAINHESYPLRNKKIFIAGMGQHFFPVWIEEKK